MLCFNLQNVFNCPKAVISNFFYESKFNVYNLTTKQVRGALSSEVLMGRNGNDITSALIKMPKAVFTDSCV